MQRAVRPRVRQVSEGDVREIDDSREVDVQRAGIQGDLNVGQPASQPGCSIMAPLAMT